MNESGKCKGYEKVQIFIFSVRKSAPLKAARRDSTGGLLPPFQISFPTAGRRRLYKCALHGLYPKTFHLIYTRRRFCSNARAFSFRLTVLCQSIQTVDRPHNGVPFQISRIGKFLAISGPKRLHRMAVFHFGKHFLRFFQVPLCPALAGGSKERVAENIGIQRSSMKLFQNV